MNEVLKHLFISSLEVASNDYRIIDNGIDLVLSIGCEIPPERKVSTVTYINYHNVLDTPDMFLLPLALICSSIIMQSIADGKNVLVHCVQGQSRSAFVVLCYLHATGMTFDDAMHTLATARSCISVNPGFLHQFHFLACVSPSSSAFRMAMSLAPNADWAAVGHKRPREEEVQRQSQQLVDDSAQQQGQVSAVGRVIACNGCRGHLADDADRLLCSADGGAAVAARLDTFWKDFKPPRSRKAAPLITLPCKALWAVCPSAWMQSTLTPTLTEAALHCPHCAAEVGMWVRRGLDLLGPFNPVDLFALHVKSVRVIRTLT